MQTLGCSYTSTRKMGGSEKQEEREKMEN